MPDFTPLFEQAHFEPIEYKGRIIQPADYFPIGKEARLKLVWESTNSMWPQAAILRADQGITLADGEQSKYWYLWEGGLVEQEFIARSKSGELIVHNAWKVNGRVMKGQNGAAMIVEELPNGRRYRCNDGYPDDDFDDLVFRIERLAEEPRTPAPKRRSRAKPRSG